MNPSCLIAPDSASVLSLRSDAAFTPSNFKCAFCDARFVDSSSTGRCSYARHLMDRHVGLSFQPDVLDFTVGRLWLCACGRILGTLAASCPCTFATSSRRPLNSLDVISSHHRARLVVASVSDRRASTLASISAVADSSAPSIDSWRRNLPIDLIRATALELDSWPPSETCVNIPLRVRPHLAEIMADLIDAMTSGDVSAGLLLKCLPKLLLHASAMRRAGPGSSSTTIANRLTMLRHGELQQLLTLLRIERNLASRTAVRQRLPTDSSSLARVRNLTRAGAFSKAIKALDPSPVISYPPDRALHWARELIPDVPIHLQHLLGARPISASERGSSHLPHTHHSSSSSISSSDSSHPSPLVPLDDDDDSLQNISSSARPPPSPSAYCQGVHFTALSAPGPSGLRPEHIRQLASCRKSREKRKFESAMSKFVNLAIAGSLPLDACRWITDSSLTYLQKPNATPDSAPRPIRVGEVLRRFVAKRIAFMQRTTLVKLFSRARQFGVAAPGGAEILLHHRIITCGSPGINEADWDIDIRNCYGTIFWTSIDSSVSSHIPAALPWTRWLHSAPTRVILPGGIIHHSQRGAEQGDPLGGAYAAAVLLDICAAALSHAVTARRSLVHSPPTSSFILAAVRSMWSSVADAAPPASADLLRPLADLIPDSPTPPQPHIDWDAGSIASNPLPPHNNLALIDTWYIDDGFIRAHPLDGDLWLAAFDAVGALHGISRNRSKSLFRSYHSAPVPPYTSASSSVLDPSSNIKYLGVSLANFDAQFRDATANLARLHHRIHSLNDPALQLTLSTQCAQVSKVSYFIRSVGPGDSRISHPSLLALDAVLADAVEHIIGTKPSPLSLAQAQLGVKRGGIGLRPASLIAFPAHLASLSQAHPYLRWLSSAMNDAGLSHSSSSSIISIVRRNFLLSIPDDRLRSDLSSKISKADLAYSSSAAAVLGIPAIPPASPLQSSSDSAPNFDPPAASTAVSAPDVLTSHHLSSPSPLSDLPTDSPPDHALDTIAIDGSSSSSSHPAASASASSAPLPLPLHPQNFPRFPPPPPPPPPFLRSLLHPHLQHSSPFPSTSSTSPPLSPSSHLHPHLHSDDPCPDSIPACASTGAHDQRHLTDIHSDVTATSSHHIHAAAAASSSETTPIPLHILHNSFTPLTSPHPQLPLGSSRPHHLHHSSLSSSYSSTPPLPLPLPQPHDASTHDISDTDSTRSRHSSVDVHDTQCTDTNGDAGPPSPHPTHAAAAAAASSASGLRLHPQHLTRPRTLAPHPQGLPINPPSQHLHSTSLSSSPTSSFSHPSSLSHPVHIDDPAVSHHSVLSDSASSSDAAETHAHPHSSDACPAFPIPTLSSSSAASAAASLRPLPDSSPLPSSDSHRHSSSSSRNTRSAKPTPLSSPTRLQHDIVDAIEAHSLKSTLIRLGHSTDPSAAIHLRRLADLSSSHSHHDWLWSINPVHGPVLHPDSYRTALRVRLGVPVIDSDSLIPCSECNVSFPADSFSNHALLCARGRRVIGHNAIRDHLASFARLSDSSARTEVPWASAADLASSPSDANNKRPADILTRATPFGLIGLAAIDVGISTPHTQDAIINPTHDILDHYRTRKIRSSTPYAQRASWSFHPFIISSFGRAHPTAEAIISQLAAAAARSFGSHNPALLSTAWWKTCGTLLADRVASMVHRCLPSRPIPAAFGGTLDIRSGPTHLPSSRHPPVGLDSLITGSQGPLVPVEL